MPSSRTVLSIFSSFVSSLSSSALCMDLNGWREVPRMVPPTVRISEKSLEPSSHGNPPRSARGSRPESRRWSPCPQFVIQRLRHAAQRGVQALTVAAARQHSDSHGDRLHAFIYPYHTPFSPACEEFIMVLHSPRHCPVFDGAGRLCRFFHRNFVSFGSCLSLPAMYPKAMTDSLRLTGKVERKPPGSRGSAINADRLGSVASNKRCCPFLHARKGQFSQKTGETTMNAWNTFTGGDWQNEINVRDFIQKNYTPYDGDGAFLAPATERTARDARKIRRPARRGTRQGRRAQHRHRIPSSPSPPSARAI